MTRRLELRPAQFGDVVSRTAPPSDLAPLVEAFAGRRAAGERAMFAVFPTARAELMFHFADPFLIGDGVPPPARPLPRAGLLGPRQSIYWQCAGPVIDWFMIQLTPLGCRRLLGIGFREAWDREISLPNLWGSRAESLYERLHEAPAFEARVAIAVETLRSWFGAPAPDAVSAAGWLARAGHVRTLQQLGQRLSVGPRRLHQLFVAEYGIGPKAFLSLMRFGRHLQARHPLHAAVAALHAHDPEYADDSHAIREFRRFTGLTPGAYAAAKSHGDKLIHTGPRIVLEVTRGP